MDQILRAADPGRVPDLLRFFKTGPGQYGEGDKFLGIAVPTLRQISKKAELPAQLEELDVFFESEYHEVRLVGSLLLQRCFEAEKDPVGKERVIEYYLGKIPRLNNWDLVDLTCYKVLGVHVLQNPQKIDILFRLADSACLWEQRVAMVSTMSLVKASKLDECYQLATKLLYHKHDLMHKAVGWLLREAGKKDEARLKLFLDQHAADMPRTTLRYSIEKFSPADRAHYMQL